MIRPWFRSRFFWLGIPGLLFLFWAWVDSENHIVLLRHANLTSETALLHWAGGVSISRIGPLATDDVITFSLQGRMFQSVEYSYFPRPVVPKWYYDRKIVAASLNGNPDASPRPDFWSVPTLSGGTSWAFLLPYWLNILCYLGIWITGTVLWQRRKVRLGVPAVSTSPPP